MKYSVPLVARGCALAVALTICTNPARAQTGSTVDTALANILITDVQIPMRDGVQLHARMWRPQDTNAPLPTIVTLTPYTVDDGQRFGNYYAPRGYVYLNVDVRGRGGSGGESWPLEGDGPDGHDVVQWVASQPWSDGRVGMRGGSYRGMTQWQTLRELPSALVTIVPTAAVYPGWDYPNPSGIFLSYAARWLAFVNGAASQSSLFGDNAYWQGKYRQLYDEHRPFADLDEMTGLPPRVFERWIQHPSFDSYWQAMSPGPEDYRRVDIPILTITGDFDGDQPGAMKYYADHMTYGTESGKNKHYLVIGPWSHGGTRQPTRELGGLTFGENSVIDIEQLHLDWFDWVFRNGERPAFLQDRVAYYVMESNEWKHAPNIEAVANGTQTWYLSSASGEAGDVFHSGELETARPVQAGFNSYVYDPLEAPQERAGLGGYVGAGMAFANLPKLVYHSAPLEQDLEASGYAKVNAYLELNVPDTDIAAFLYEVRANGTTIYLGASELRARHRNGVDREDLAVPGEVEQYVFDRFYWFSRKLLAGSRLRLVITPLDSPDRDKNYNAGGNTVYETDEDAQPAVVKLHYGGRYPSAVVLPVMRH
jgi:putative CocE/NonD family hydrolase